jgi:hypothetical protein
MAAHWTTTAMFWATVALVGISLVAAILNYLGLVAATEPNIVVYAKADQSRPSFILLVIENTGPRLAKNVRFSMSEAIPSQRAGGPMTKGPLFTGIPALGPRDRREMFWGAYLFLQPLLQARVIEIKARFQSDPLLRFGDLNDHEVTSMIDIHSFAETDAVDPDGSRQSARELKRIADIVEERLG